jgi:hypothetical protein
MTARVQTSSVLLCSFRITRVCTVLFVNLFFLTLSLAAVYKAFCYFYAFLKQPMKSKTTVSVV